MGTVHLPFLPRFREPLLKDVKTMTCRTRRHGREGDRFQVFGSWFLIDAVFREDLDVMADQWEAEGCTSREDFVRIWEQLHPSGFDPTKRVVVHTFHRRGSAAAYPDDWAEISLRVRKAAGWRCERCGHPDDAANGRLLTVHHVDMDPGNVEEENLAPLCQKCHLYVQSHRLSRDQWRNQEQTRLEVR